MKRFLATFSGQSYDHITERTIKAASGFGVDRVLVYDNAWLDRHPYRKLNDWIFNLPGVRGISWFSWKPLCIMDALERFCEPGDCLLFLDGDCYPIADLTPLYDRCVQDGGVLLHAAQGCSNRQWVKADCWITMAAHSEYPGRRNVPIDSQHAVARFMWYERGPWHVQQFLMEWLTYCLNPLATTFDKSVLGPEVSGFEQHRTEQAILSLLAHKYGHHLYREACQFGNGALAEGVDDWYGQLFVQIGCGGGGSAEGSRFRNV